MLFRVDPGVAQLLPDMQVVVVVAQGINNAEANPDVDDLRERVWREIRPMLANMRDAGDHARIAPYRAILKNRAGISAKRHPQSNELLFKQVLKAKKLPRPLNPIVDLYNSLSLRFGVPMGGFDLAALQSQCTAPLELRQSQYTDKFLAYDEQAGAHPQPMSIGELVYAQGTKILRRQLSWKPAMHGLIGERTTDVILVCEVLQDCHTTRLPSELAWQIKMDIQACLQTCFGVNSTACIVGGRLPHQAMPLPLMKNEHVKREAKVSERQVAVTRTMAGAENEAESKECPGKKHVAQE